MLSNDYIPFLSLFIFVPTVLFYLYYRKITRKYKNFTSYRLDIGLMCKILGLRHQKNVPAHRYIFQEVVSYCKKHEKEGACLIWFFQPHLIIYGEEFVKALSNNPACRDKPEINKARAEVLGNGLVTSNGEKWIRHRKLMDPLFRVGMLKDKMNIFNEHAADLVKNLRMIEGKPTKDTVKHLMNCIFSILIESVMDFDFSDEEDKLKSRHFQYVIRKITKPMMLRRYSAWLYRKLLFLCCHEEREYLKMQKMCDTFTIEAIQKMEKKLISRNSLENGPEGGSHTRRSFAELLIKQMQKDPTFTRQDLKDEVLTLLTAGFHTVHGTLMWCLILLGLHPEIQERAYEEVVSNTSNDVSYDDLSNLIYLECIIKETLRLYPTIPMFDRKLTNDVQCGEHLIPKGTNIGFMVYMIHRNPEHYPDPEKFDPDRFLASSDIRPWMFMPFSEGYRNCIGKRFAMMEMKVILSHILRNFNVTSLEQREDIVPDWKITLLAAKPPLMQFEFRKTNQYE